MSSTRAGHETASKGNQVASRFGEARRGLKKPAIDSEPWQSPIDALAKGLIAIGEKFRARPPLRVL